MPATRTLLILMLFPLSVVAVGWMVRQGHIAVPPRWNPWAPLDLAEAPGPFTRLKLGRLADGPPGACHAWLDAAGARHTPVADRFASQDCGWQGATRLQAFGGVRLSSAVPMTCPQAVALTLWERHALQPAALAQLGSRVTGVDHLGSYACRNIAGGRQERRSEHASANALDIAGFRLADGRLVSVRKDWRSPDTQDAPPQALFLRQASTGACTFFSAVLGPAYNAAHHDHLHLDRGPYRICS